MGERRPHQGASRKCQRAIAVAFEDDPRPFPFLVCIGQLRLMNRSRPLSHLAEALFLPGHQAATARSRGFLCKKRAEVVCSDIDPSLSLGWSRRIRIPVSLHTTLEGRFTEMD
jgi:hypothetical protein